MSQSNIYSSASNEILRYLLLSETQSWNKKQQQQHLLLKYKKKKKILNERHVPPISESGKINTTNNIREIFNTTAIQAMEKNEKLLKI